MVSFAAAAAMKENNSWVSAIAQGPAPISVLLMAKCSAVPFPRSEVIREKEEVHDLQTAQTEILVVVLLQV